MRQLFIKTEKSFIADLPRYTFGGKIVTVSSPDEAARAVEVLRRSELLGIDTETRPVFRRGAMRPVALLQVATDDLCFLFRLHHMGLPPALASLLADEAVPKVGLSLHDDVHQLRQRMPDLQPAGLIELQDVAEHMGLEDKSLQKLFANFFHMRISKGAQLSNWEADALTEAQRLYAATDAAACILLYREMLALQQSRDYQLVG